MEAHVNSICKNAIHHLRRIGLVRKFLTHESAVTIIHALVISRLDYLNSLLAGLPADTTAKLQRVQNCAARVISGVSRRDHISPTLNELHWLRVQERIEFKIILLCHKCIMGTAPVYLQELLQVKQPVRSLRSSDGLQLIQPRGRLVAFGDRAFSCIAPRLWNQLPLKQHLCLRSSPEVLPLCAVLILFCTVSLITFVDSGTLNTLILID